jgi:hypothetical protein
MGNIILISSCVVYSICPNSRLITSGTLCERAATLAPGDSLSISHDLQNLYDPKALLLHTEDRYNLGYCPRYLAHDIFSILQDNPQQVKVKIDRVNQPPTPLQSRLLCTMTAECGRDFVPFAGEDYQPLLNSELILR